MKKFLSQYCNQQKYGRYWCKLVPEIVDPSAIVRHN